MTGLFVRKHAVAAAKYAVVNVLYVKAEKGIKHFEIIENDNENVHEIYVYYPSSKNKLKFFSAYKKGFQILKKNNFVPDIIHANIFAKAAIIAYLYGLCKKTPYVITEHWSRYLSENNTYKGFFKKIVTSFIARRASAILPVSMVLEKAMKANGINNNYYKVVHNVVDDFFFEADTHASASAEISLPIILHVSCFDDKVKNISGILQAAKILSRKRNDFKLVLIGTGIDFEKIKTRTTDKNVIFLGEKTPEEVSMWMKKCAFTVLFSNYETSAVVVSESLAAGRPVVATNTGGIPEKINSSNGIMIPPKDTKKLVNAMDEMLDKYSFYKSEQISKKAYEDYSFATVGKQIFDIYKNVLNKSTL